MNPKYLLAVFLLSVFAISKGFTQNNVSGKVIDAETGKPLAFVNIVINDSPSGDVTDIDGKFYLSYKGNIENLHLSYVGYYSKIYKPEGRAKGLIIALKPRQLELSEVVIRARENPAHRIIRRLVENEKLNNPKYLDSYSYTSYDKMILTAELDSLMSREVSELDSSQMNILDFFNKRDIFMMETVSEHKYMRPDLSRDDVVASQMSGFKDPLFVFMISQLQSTSFYERLINIGDKNYINPAGRGSIGKYFFSLEDTLFTAGSPDTTFVIAYRPMKNTNFDGLKGLLYVNTHKYAIQNVIAEPMREESGMGIKIQQMYELVDSSHWFPVQLNTDISFRNATVEDTAAGESFTLVGIGKSYIRDIELQPELVKRQFDNIAVNVMPDAYRQTDSIWNAYRIDSLSPKERETYRFVDSIGEANNFDRLAKSLEILLTGSIPYRFINFRLDQIMRFNDYEGYYLGLGLESNQRFSRSLSMRAFGGYSFKDKDVKYGASARIAPFNDKDYYLKLEYQNTATESGGMEYFNDKYRITDYRDFLIKRMNHTQEGGMAVGFRILSYMNVEAGMHMLEKGVDYGYRYLPESGDSYDWNDSYRFTEFRLGIRYAYREKYIKNVRTKMSVGTSYPVLRLQYSKGLDGVLDGEHSYHKLNAELSYSFYTPYLGKTGMKLQAAYIDGDAPAMQMFNGNGSYRLFTLYAPESFATMRMNEFLNDRFFALYLKHSFGSLLFRTEKFRPELVVLTNIGYGSVNNPALHDGITVKSMDKGYYESGLLVRKLINTGLTSLGLGAFYRYGPYGFDAFKDNIALKITIGFPIFDD